MTTTQAIRSDAFDVLRRTDDIDMMALKRAYWEQFRFEETDEEGRVDVFNESWGHKEDEHAHTVTVGGHIPCHCTCSSFKYRSSPCKHVIATVLEYEELDQTAASRGSVVV